ncbi:MAG TPA: hypothetical protein VFL73_05400 [Solirubrobacteraceae bacterium]|nr:hypothetical protein [Solirubrobacteraceae bacterium]
MIARARQRLPRSHRALLEQVGVQETVLDDWPAEVQGLYATLGERPPAGQALANAVAVWLPARRVVAFNSTLLSPVLLDTELTLPTKQILVENVAWHEYGHALSATLASPELRRSGPQLVERLPMGLRQAIDYPGSYRRGEVFDEVIANVYALMIRRAVHSKDYGFPSFLHDDVVSAFNAVIPWPPRSNG